MSEPQTANTDDPADQPQPAEDSLDATKEAMRRALDAKKGAQQHGADGVTKKKSIGGPHGKEGGSRQFRRKSGG